MALFTLSMFILRFVTPEFDVLPICGYWTYVSYWRGPEGCGEEEL